MTQCRHSRLFVGHVRHRRFYPIQHAFQYSLFMPAIDLDELETLEKTVWGFGQSWWHWARFKNSDYMSGENIKLAVQEKVAELTGMQCRGRVLAVCHLRYFGLYFSPVNFYYLYDEKGEWQYLLAEVSNTPWHERHYYAIANNEYDAQNGWQHPKAFHVSPFNPMDQVYQWKISAPDTRLKVHLECHQQEKHFDATLAMSSVPFTSSELTKLLFVTPIQTVKVMVGIYWHAFKLWRKGAPFYTHPNAH